MLQIKIQYSFREFLLLGSQVNASNAQQCNRSSPTVVDENSNSDKKLAALSRSSTPENAEFGDSREHSSLSKQILGGESSIKVQSSNDSNARKKKPENKK